MSFGPGVNASTTFDHTTYRLTVPTDQAEFVEKGIQILEDWVHQINFEAEDIEQERGVVLEKFSVPYSAPST